VEASLLAEKVEETATERDPASEHKAELQQKVEALTQRLDHMVPD
jgi:hypothetical protein